MAQKRRVRQEFKEWFLATIVEEGGGNCPELVKRGMLHFSQDAEWCYRLMQEEFYLTLYRIGQEVLSVGRRLGGIALEDSREQDGWDRCVIFERPLNQYVLLGEMTRPQLYAAAYNRERRAQAEEERAQALRELAEMLPDDTTRLREVCDYSKVKAILTVRECIDELPQMEEVLVQA